MQNAFEARISVELADNPGIVHKVTSLLASNRISVTKLSTQQELAPFGGTTLFSLTGLISSAEPVDPDRLRSAFDLLQQDTGIDVNIDILDCVAGVNAAAL